MISLNPERYSVRKNDNLDTLSRNRGYSGWRSIYYSDFNKELRRKRPDPNYIQPGDNIIFPPKASDVVAVLKRRYDSYLTLQAEFNKDFDKEHQSFESEYNKIKSNLNTIDNVNTAINLGKGLANVAVAGKTALGKGAKELAEAEKALYDFGYNQLKSKAHDEFVNSQKSDNVIIGVTQVLAESYSKMTTPSFWTSTLSQLLNGKSWSEAVTSNEKTIYQETIGRLKQTQKAVNDEWNSKLTKTKKLIEKFSSYPDDPVPLVDFKQVVRFKS